MQRIEFLQHTAKLNDPKQVAFLLKNNKFDEIDYFYVPLDEINKIATFKANPLYFPAITKKILIKFPFRTTVESPYFIKKHENNIFAILNPSESVVDIFGTSDSNEFIAQAKTYLKKNFADSLN